MYLFVHYVLCNKKNKNKTMLNKKLRSQVVSALGLTRGDGVQDRACVLPHDVRAPHKLRLRALHARGERQPHSVARGCGGVDVVHPRRVLLS